MKRWFQWTDESLSYLFRNVDIDSHLQLWFQELDQILVNGRGPEPLCIPKSVRDEFIDIGEPASDPNYLIG